LNELGACFWNEEVVIVDLRGEVVGTETRQSEGSFFEAEDEGQGGGFAFQISEELGEEIKMFGNRGMRFTKGMEEIGGIAQGLQNEEFPAKAEMGRDQMNLAQGVNFSGAAGMV
jgi:hypothetical protein